MIMTLFVIGIMLSFSVGFLFGIVASGTSNKPIKKSRDIKGDIRV